MSSEWIRDRKQMEKDILQVLFKHKPSGSEDIRDWMDHGRWIGFALEQAPVETAEGDNLRQCKDVLAGHILIDEEVDETIPPSSRNVPSTSA